jgi:hypothetical protein
MMSSFRHICEILKLQTFGIMADVDSTEVWAFVDLVELDQSRE